MATAARLWHYTCDDAAPKISADGFLRPAPQPVLGENCPPLIWLTDLHPPIRDALGLTQNLVSCDRMAHAFEVISPVLCHWWPTWRRMTSLDLDNVDAVRLNYGANLLAQAPGAMPAHWWVATDPTWVLAPEKSCFSDASKATGSTP